MDLFILPERERPMPPPSLLREIDAYAVTAGEISHNEIRGKRFNRVYILPGVTLSPEVEDAAEFCLYGAHSKESAFIYGVDAQEDWEMAKRLMQKLKQERRVDKLTPEDFPIIARGQYVYRQMFSSPIAGPMDMGLSEDIAFRLNRDEMARRAAQADLSGNHDFSFIGQPQKAT